MHRHLIKSIYLDEIFDLEYYHRMGTWSDRIPRCYQVLTACCFHRCDFDELTHRTIQLRLHKSNRIEPNQIGQRCQWGETKNGFDWFLEGCWGIFGRLLKDFWGFLGIFEDCKGILEDAEGFLRILRGFFKMLRDLLGFFDDFRDF